MVNILFIHDYDSVGNSAAALLLKSLVKEYARLVAPDFTKNPKAAIKKSVSVIDLYRIDLIVGNSYGGFIALNIPKLIPKILINPILEPSKELPKRYPEAEKSIHDFIELETKFSNKHITEEEKTITYCLFPKHDKEISCKDAFSKLYPHIETIHGGREMTSAAIEKSVVPLIYQLIRVLQLHR